MTGSTVIIPQYTQSISEHSAVRLARYATIVGYNENPFWGINYNVGDQCRYIWMLSDRIMAAKYLAEAQDEIEEELNYLIGYQWTAEPKKVYRYPMFTKWGNVIAFGIEGITTISAGVAVDHTSDPAVIGPIVTTVTDPSEIVVYHPGTSVEITPSKITIAGGNVTIEIPFCRLVMLSHADNPADGWQYTDYTTVWGEHTVDVKRRYNDTSTQAVLSSNHQCSPACSSTGCSAFTQTACGYIKQPQIGLVDVLPADYAAGTWTRKTCTCECYHEAQLNYLSGVELTPQLEDMIVRLAHSKMPKEPCGCDPLKHLWERDNHIPEAMSVQQATCLFGQSDGAYTAWKFAHAIKLVRGGIVG